MIRGMLRYNFKYCGVIIKGGAVFDNKNKQLWSSRDRRLYYKC